MTDTVQSPPEGFYGTAQTPRPPMSRAAVAGFVLVFFCWPAGLVASIVGVRHTGPGGKRGRGLAVAGLLLNGAALIIAVLVGIVVAIVGAADGSTSSKASATSVATPTHVASAAPTAHASPKPSATTPPPSAKATTPAPAPARSTSAPAAPAATFSQQQALRSAKQYLSMQAFSYAGLIKQLSSSYGDGFSQADATYAADHCGADWNAEAAKAAKQYLSMQSFSHAGLVDQLDSAYGDQYTPAQAEYGVKQAGL